MASILLNETGYPPDVIELQLAHRSETRCARLTIGRNVSMNAAT
jgi:hypothetical protein